MICNATYDSFEAIPDIAVGDGRLRDEFEQVKGKWQLKANSIPGVAPLFNAGLVANEERAVTQAKNAKKAKDDLQLELDAAKDKLAVLDIPGSKVLSKEDALLFDNYVKLGTPTELEKIKTEHVETSTKLKTLETKETVTKAISGMNLNPDVLTDWLESAEGITIFTKTVEQADAKGVKTQVEVPYVRIEETKDGKTNVSEKELLIHAKESLPEWKYTALTTAVVESSKPTGMGQPTNTVAAGGGVRVPNLGSQQSPAPDKPDKRPVDIANEARDARPNPFKSPLALGGPGGTPTAASTGKVA